MRIGHGLLALGLTWSASAPAHEVVPPRALEQPAAAWPGGRAEAHDVIVPVVLTIDAGGRVESVDVEASVGESFDAAAVQAALGWRFEPARGADGPVRAKVRAVVRFLAKPAGTPKQVRTRVHAHPHVHSHSAPPEARQPVAVVGHGEAQHRGVVVEGSRAARAASEVERDQRLLEVSPHRTASDLMQTVPGVFVTQHSGEGKAHQIFFRGFDAAHGQDLEIWVAGAPVNDVSNLHGQGYADLHFVMPEAVQRLRAQGGPFDPRQGDFAVAGSLDFELGLAKPGRTLELSVGNFGARRAFLAYRPEGAPEQTFAAAELQRSDGFGEGRAAQRASALAQVVQPLGDELDLRVFASTYAGRFGSAGVLRLEDVESGRMGRFESYDTRQGGHSTRTQLVAELSSSTGSARWSLAPYLVLRSMTLRQNYTGFVEEPLRGDGNVQVNDATTVGFRSALRQGLRLFSSRDSVELGAFGRSDHIEQAQRRVSRVDGAVFDTPVAARIQALDVGGYADVALHPLSRVVLRGGARIDGLSYRTVNDAETGGAARSAQGAHVGKKLTLDVALAPGLHALASYGEGFRSPQARSLADGERTPFTTVSSLEAGLRYGESRELRASLALFRSALSDDLVFDERTARNEPVPPTARLGAVADLAAELGDFLTAAVGASYTRATFQGSNARYSSGALVPYVPELVVRTDLGVRTAITKLASHSVTGSAGFGTSTLYRRPLPYSELGHDVWLVDARAGLAWRELELEASATNLLDREWYDGEFVYASSFDPAGTPSQLPVRHVTAGAPRTIFVTMGVHF
ncbi:MAG: TonB-dependent receptor [Myxococcales bacterium]|nr:TonB-dependent receptor [Myxococcales bacterium]